MNSTRIRIRAALVLSLLLSSSCITETVVKPSSIEHDEIMEAVFRHIASPKPLEKLDDQDVGVNREVYSVQVAGWLDPTPGFLGRFTNDYVVVKSLSAASSGSDRGVRLDFGWIIREGRNRADVEVSVSQEGYFGYTVVYRVVKKRGRWTVKGKKYTAVAWRQIACCNSPV